MTTFNGFPDQVYSATLTGSDGIKVTGSLSPNKIIISASNVPNSSLQNSAVNFNGVTVGLGATGSITLTTPTQVSSAVTSALSQKADVNASYIVLVNTASLTNERALTPGTGISITDSGANSTLTVNVNSSVVLTSNNQTISGIKTFTNDITASTITGSLAKFTNITGSSISGSSLKLDGNITLTNTGGIVFGTTSGLVSSTTLSDYEEGTFVPAIASGFTGGIQPINQGYYVKIGKTVTFDIFLVVATTTPNSSNITISGLPYAAVSTGHAGFALFQNHITGTVASSQMFGIIPTSTQQINLKANLSASLTGVAFAGTGSSAVFELVGQYRTAS
jgi:hypothetical protein